MSRCRWSSQKVKAARHLSARRFGWHLQLAGGYHPRLCSFKHQHTFTTTIHAATHTCTIQPLAQRLRWQNRAGSSAGDEKYLWKLKALSFFLYNPDKACEARMTYERTRREHCLPFRAGLPQVRLWHACCRFLAPHSAHRLSSQRALPAKYHAARQESVHLNLTPEITKTHRAKQVDSEVSESANAYTTLHAHTVLPRYRFHICPCTRVRARKDNRDNATYFCPCGTNDHSYAGKKQKCFWDPLLPQKLKGLLPSDMMGLQHPSDQRKKD